VCRSLFGTVCCRVSLTLSSWQCVSACRFFYLGKLLDGSGINAVSKGAPFHSKLAYGPMVVWDCQEGRERGGGARGGGSLQNPAEAELAATLVAGEHARGGSHSPAPRCHTGECLAMPVVVQHASVTLIVCMVQGAAPF
jgi:hypothetical protein